MIAVVQICIGVSLTIVGSMETSAYGLVAIFFSIISTAFRSVMYKMTIDEHESLTSYSVYLNTSYVSFLLFLPCFILKVLYMRYSDEDFSYLSVQFDADVGKVLLAASVFNFLYNLLSIIVLANFATLTHPVINVTISECLCFTVQCFFCRSLSGRLK